MYLALSNPPRFHRRDSLLARFWPESSDEKARLALRQTLHFLRQTLGSAVVVSRGADEVGLDFGSVWCDVRAFEGALDDGRLDEALALYRGDLLEGFHASGVAPEFGQWVESERARLRARAVRAATQLADAAERSGNGALAAQRLRELLRLEPGAEGALRRLMTLLDQAGDRAGALRAYDDLVRHLAAEIEAEPAPETVALAERVRGGRGTAPAIAVPAQPPPPSATPTPAPAPHEPRRSTPIRLTPDARPWWGRKRRLALVAAAVLLLVAAAAGPWLAASWRRGAAGPGAAMVLAVGAVDVHAGADSLGTMRVLRGLLATDLARVPGVTVVSPGRLEELLAQRVGGTETRAALTEAARGAGATEVLEGELYRRASGVLRLDLRRVALAGGHIRRAYSAEGADLFAVVEQVSAQLASEVGQPAPSPALAELTTTSLVARRFYEEGVRAYYRTDAQTAMQLFRTALAEDSTFAMAAYYAARTMGTDPQAALAYAAQAVRMSGRATERERLLIATEWAGQTNAPSLVTLAESLARRFPLEPDAQMGLGGALMWSGDFLGAVPHFWRVVERDSLGLAESERDPGGPGRPPCAGCGALGYLVVAYQMADSLQAAERVGREWIRRLPRSATAWSSLAVTLRAEGRTEEAIAAYRTRQSLVPVENQDDALDRIALAIWSGDFDGADRLLAERLRDGDSTQRLEGLWWQVISLRNQGRLAEAARVARRARAEDGSLWMLEAQVLFELGRPREAAALFQELVDKAPPPLVPAGAPDSALGLRARQFSWHLTLVGSASAAAGDTARLARLTDSVAAVGALGAYGRDRRLHHHLRGLLLLARGQRDSAAASFRRAIYSPTQGYTRTNLELGRVLLALGRPGEAAAALAPALRGDLQASNYYVTHAELHEALAQAYEAAGRRDSARVHYAWVANAWRNADPPFLERAARAATRAR